MSPLDRWLSERSDWFLLAIAVVGIGVLNLIDWWERLIDRWERTRP